MTPKENYIAAITGKKPDQLPIYATNMIDFLHFYYDVPFKAFLDEPDIHVELTTRSAHEFGFGCVVPVAYIFFGCGPELGIHWKFRDSSLPGAVGDLVQTHDDISKIKIPPVPSGYFSNYIQILSKLKRQIGDTVYVLGLVLGPFSTACFLRGTENAILDPLTKRSAAICMITPGVKRSHSKLFTEQSNIHSQAIQPSLLCPEIC